MRGRPKCYENQAEKQKAYRERKKVQPQPLRKSAAVFWADKRDEYAALYDQHQKIFPKREIDYPDWSKEFQRIYALWGDAQHKAYYLGCYERGWFITEGVRFKLMPDIEQWIKEYDHANG